jgi:hypothetical protein
MAQERAYQAQTTVRLELPDQLAPGRSGLVQVHLQPDLGWHTYFTNPGETGMPAQLAWTFPAGWTITPRPWPTPRRYQSAGIASFVHDRLTLSFDLQAPADSSDGTAAAVGLRLDWLTCAAICVAGSAELSGSVTVDSNALEAPAAPAELGQNDPEGWSWSIEGSRLTVRGPGPMKAFDCLPVSELAPAAWPVSPGVAADGVWSLELPVAPPAGSRLLVINRAGWADPSRTGWYITVPAATESSLTSPSESSP